MSVWEDIKNRLSVEDVISDYIPIKPKGVNFTCNCPFHNEKTPSLIISPEKQIWHCFGCGAGGNIFGFVELIENLSKQEVLQKLAAKANVKLEPLKRQTQKSKPSNSSLPGDHQEQIDQDSNYSESSLSQGYDLLEWTSQLYHKLLLQTLQDPDHPVSQYCYKRGLTREIIIKFQLGLAPDSSIISQLLSGRDSQIQVAKDLSLIKD